MPCYNLDLKHWKNAQLCIIPHGNLRQIKKKKKSICKPPCDRFKLEIEAYGWIMWSRMVVRPSLQIRLDDLA
jgi:hypothetical protein